MSYYTYVLEKYDISDCETFEDVKNKFPDTSPTFLRKVIWLKDLKVGEKGRLEGGPKKALPLQQGSSNRRETVKPLAESFKKQKQKRYPKVNCPQCGKEIFLVYPNDPFCSRKCKKEYGEVHEGVRTTGESLEDLKKLEKRLRRNIELTGGQIESQTKHLKKLIEDYHHVWTRITRKLEIVPEKDVRSRTKNSSEKSKIKRLRKNSRIRHLRAYM